MMYEPPRLAIGSAPACSTAVAVSAGIVRWVRGGEYGIETLVMNETSRQHLAEYINVCSQTL